LGRRNKNHRGVGEMNWEYFWSTLIATFSGVVFALIVDLTTRRILDRIKYKKMKLGVFRELDYTRRLVDSMSKNLNLSKGTNVERFSISSLDSFLNHDLTHRYMRVDYIEILRHIIRRTQIVNLTLDTMHQLWILGKGNRVKNEKEVKEKLSGLHKILLTAREIL